MASFGRLVMAVTIALAVGCTTTRESATTGTTSTTGASTTGAPTTGAPSTALPATTERPPTSLEPATSAAAPTGVTLRSVLGPYEQAAIAASNGSWKAFEFDRCRRVTRSGADASTAPVDQQGPVARGDVFDCYLRTDPPADVLNDFYVIVLDDSGRTWANGAGTDGSFFLPTVPSGLLCRDYLADPAFVTSMGGHGPQDPTQESWWADNEWAYASVLAYWFIDGQRADMDVDRNDIPCELLFDPATVARVWAGNRP